MFVKLTGLGLGRHAEAFPLENIFPYFRFMYFYSVCIVQQITPHQTDCHQVLIIFAYSFIKLSIGFFLLRLADRTKWRPFLIGMLGKCTVIPSPSPNWQLTASYSIHRLLYDWLDICNHLPMHASSSRMGLHPAPANWVRPNPVQVCVTLD